MSIKIHAGDLSELDLRLVNAWAKFREKIGDFVNNMDECTVELHFESSLDPRTHFGFEPDEAVFISDIAISNDNKVTFVVPHGAKTKTFFYQEAELINAKYKGETRNLMEFITDFYKESFAEVPEAPTITMLERKCLTANAELKALLNNAEEVIKQHQLTIERVERFSKLDDFGMF